MSKKNKKSPNTKLIKALSFISLLGLFAFVFGWLFVGIAKYEIKCVRLQPGKNPDCEICETRLFGLHRRVAKAEQVISIGYSTKDVDPSYRTGLGSTVVLRTINGDIPISKAASNTGRNWKVKTIETVGDFINNQERLKLEFAIKEINIFGWVSLSIIAFIILSYSMWIFKKIKHYLTKQSS